VKAARNASDEDVDQLLLSESAGGDSLPIIPIPYIPLPNAAFPEMRRDGSLDKE